MAATAFAPVLILHGPAACYRFLASLMHVPALRQLLQRARGTADAHGGSAGGPAGGSRGRSSWRRLWGQHSCKLPKAQPSLPPRHLAPPPSPRSPLTSPNLKQRRTSTSAPSPSAQRPQQQQQQQQEQEHRQQPQRGGSPSRMSAEAKAKLMGNGPRVDHTGDLGGWTSTARSSSVRCCCGPPSGTTAAAAAGGSAGADASTSDCIMGAPGRPPPAAPKSHGALLRRQTHGSPSPLPPSLLSPTSALEWRGSAPGGTSSNRGSAEERRTPKPPVRSPPAEGFPRARSLAPARAPTLDLVSLLGPFSPSAASPGSDSKAAAALRALCAALSSPGLATQPACPETPISGAPAGPPPLYDAAAVDTCASPAQSARAPSAEEGVLEASPFITVEDGCDQGSGSAGVRALKASAAAMAKAGTVPTGSGSPAAAERAAVAAAATAAPRAASAQLPCSGSSPLYTSSNMSYFMSVKVRHRGSSHG